MARDTFSTLFGNGRTGGAANQRTDDPPPDPRPANTLITWKYRDEHNYSTTATAVLAGRFESADLQVIRGKLQDDESFIPSQVGLEDLQASLQQYDSDAEFDENGVNDADHVWHELDLPDAVSLTDDEPTVAMPWPALVQNFADVQWDESAVDLSR